MNVQDLAPRYGLVAQLAADAAIHFSKAARLMEFSQFVMDHHFAYEDFEALYYRRYQQDHSAELGPEGSHRRTAIVETYLDSLQDEEFQS